jgi:hypothetical protein
MHSRPVTMSPTVRLLKNGSYASFRKLPHSGTTSVYTFFAECFDSGRALQ